MKIEIKELDYGYSYKDDDSGKKFDGGFVLNEDNLPALCKHIVDRCYQYFEGISPAKTEITLSGSEHMLPSEYR